MVETGQELAYSPITGRVYIVNKFRRIDEFGIDVIEKVDVTEQFDRIAEMRQKEERE